MTNSRTPQEGGLLLKRVDLQEILDEPGTIGIAFALSQPGQADNVDLQILRVSMAGNSFIGDIRPISTNRKKGVAGPLHFPASECDDFRFHYLSQLQNDGFFFGFFDDFEKLFKERDDWDEIFIGGGKQLPTPNTFERNEWFTFNVTMRKSLKESNFLNREEARVFVNHTWPGARSHDLPEIKRRGSILVEELVNAVTTISNLSGQKKNTLLHYENNGLLQGIVFDDGTSVFFDKTLPFQSIQLDEHHHLKAIHLEPEVVEPEFLESLNLGIAFPFSLPAIGCPPQWPKDEALPGGFENNIRMAVEAALNNH